MNSRTVTAVVTVFALVLLVLGIGFVFAPEESAAVVTGQEVPELAFSLLGAALVGLGAMNWLTRRVPIGGIYGRPVLMANLAHFVIGGLTLLRVGLGGGGAIWLWALCAFYLSGAGFYGALLFAPPKQTKRAPS